jgi:hypothetical protein
MPRVSRYGSSPTHTQHANWHGTPERLPDGFTLTKTKGATSLTGVCEVWTHKLGWEMRLMIGDGHGMLVSSVVRSAEDLREKTRTWRSAMIEKGWREVRA